jgi:hypothetical protein
MPRWHASTYLCTLLGCYGDVPQGNTGGGNPKVIMMKGSTTMEIHLDLPIMAYLQVGEVSMGLTPKEWYRVVHRVK